MAEWTVKNKIDYTEDTLDVFSLKTRDEFDLIYILLNRLRSFGAATGSTSDTTPYQPYIDATSGKLFIRNADNTAWIEIGSVKEKFFGIKPEDIGAAKKLVGKKSEIPSSADTYDLYFAIDEKKLYYFTGLDWEVGLSLNFEDLSNYKDFCVSLDEVDYSGKDKILRLDKTTGKGNIDITGSAGKFLRAFLFYQNEVEKMLNKNLIKTYTNEGEVVLDATIGSGSTAVAAINTGRKFIGFETDEKYFEVSQKRIAEALQKKSEGGFLI